MVLTYPNLDYKKKIEFGLKEFKKVGELITKTIKGLSANPNDNTKVEDEVRKEVVELCSKFPIYKHLR